MARKKSRSKKSKFSWRHHELYLFALVLIAAAAASWAAAK